MCAVKLDNSAIKSKLAQDVGKFGLWWFGEANVANIPFIQGRITSIIEQVLKYSPATIPLPM